MIETLRQMIMGVTAAAIFSTVMLQFTQKSALQEIIKLGAGMVMILALLMPVSRLSLPSFTGWFAQAQEMVSAQTAHAQTQNELLTQSSIAGAVSRYVEGQAGEMGVACHVETTLQEGLGGTLEIVTVTITGRLTDMQRDSLAALIVQNCGVTRENITFAEV